MRVKSISCIVLAVIFLWSCGNRSGNDLSEASNIIHQQPDGTYELKLEKAACYSDDVDPASNTAEWKIHITEPGRYKVWLKSATIDTTDLNYANTVKISFLDNQIEADPVADKIVGDSEEVTYPYYRADSYMGSFYFGEPGEYYIQVISEKVIPYEALNQSQTPADTKLVSVNLTPMKR